jgi:hypothetical protein
MAAQTAEERLKDEKDALLRKISVAMRWGLKSVSFEPFGEKVVDAVIEEMSQNWFVRRVPSTDVIYYPFIEWSKTNFPDTRWSKKTNCLLRWLLAAAKLMQLK